MKRLLLIVVAVLGLSMSESLSAQSGLLGALKGVATELIDEATGGQATALVLPGVWNYNTPAIRLQGSDTLSDALAGVAVSSFEQKLKQIYDKVGIKQGSCSFTFDTGDTFSMVVGSRCYNGKYEYNAEDHSLKLTFDTTLIRLGTLTGYAYINGESMDLVFDCSKFFDFLVKLGAKLSATNSLSQMLEKYDGMMIGFTLAR